MSDLIVEVSMILNIEKHPNADTLDIATVKGWKCIVKRGEFKVGDAVIFVPPDSVLPRYLIDKYDIGYLKNKHGRVGVVKLRGEYSEGLILPNDDNFPVGKNIASDIGIVKWEPRPAQELGKRRVNRKKITSKILPKYTDIQNIKHFIECFTDNEEVVITEKIHGTNFRCGYVYPRGLIGKFLRAIKKPIFIYGSRNVELLLKQKFVNNYYRKNYYKEAVLNYNLHNVCKAFPEFIFFGEIFGAGIQDLTYGRNSDRMLLFFDVFDLKARRYLDYKEFVAIMQEAGLSTVPVLYVGPYSDEEVFKHYIGASALHEKTLREGVVVRPIKERVDPKLGRVVLKAVSPVYLTRKAGTEFH